MIDPDSAIGLILLNILAGVGIAAIIGIASWLLGPLKRPVYSLRIRKLILANRRFVFVYNPEANKRKFVTFLESGEIGEGRNNNENRWRIRRGQLEILSVDGRLYSRFKYDLDMGRLVHTNDPDTRSITAQYFVPQWQRPDL